MTGFLKKLQDKPYEQKVRILWITIAVSAIVILAIWFVTLRFRSMERADGSRFAPLKESFQKIKDIKFSK